MKKISTYLKKIQKWVLRLLLGLLVLFVLGVLVLQLSPVQTLVVRKAISEISGRTGTEMSLQKINLRIPFGVSLKGLCIEDRQGDTLLYAGSVKVSVNMVALLRNRVKVRRVELENIMVNIARPEPDTTFNFQFFIEALSRNKNHAKPAISGAGSPVAWTFELGRLSISHARLRFADYFSGIALHTSIGGFSTTIEGFDPAAFRYHLGKTSIEQTSITLALNQPGRPAEARGSEPPRLDLALPELLVSSFSFYLKTHDGQVISTAFDKMAFRSRKLDITGQYIDLESFTLEGLLAELALPERPAEAKPVDSASEQTGFRWADTFEWRFASDIFEIRNSELAFSTAGKKPVPRAFNAANFRFNDIELLAENIKLTPEVIKLRVGSLKARSGNDFRLDRLSAEIELGETLSISGLNIETGLSFLQGDFMAGLTPLSLPPASLDAIPVNLSIQRGRIATDLAFFAPRLREYFQGTDRLLFAATASGTTADLTIDTLWAESPGAFTLAFGGNIKNIHEAEFIEVLVPQALLMASPKKLRRFIPKDRLPENLDLPDSLHLQASLAGDMQKIEAAFALSSSFGGINLQTTFSELLSAMPRFKASLQIAGFNPGQLLMQKHVLGPFYARAEMTGTGFNPENMEAAFDLVVSSATVNNYEYSGLNVSGQIAAGVTDFTLGYHDEHLNLQLVSRLALYSKHPHALVHCEIIHLNPKALNFSEEEFIFKAVVEADMKLTQPDFAEGSLLVQQAQVFKGQDLFTLDKLEINTGFSDGLYRLMAVSSIFNADFRGSVSPLKMPGLMVDHVAGLMSAEPDTVPAASDSAYFEFNAQILPSRWFNDFLLPDISFFDPVAIEARFDGIKSLMGLEVVLPILHYGNLTLHGCTLEAGSKGQTANVSARLPMLRSDGFQIHHLSFEALLHEKLLDFGLSFSDRNDKPWLNLSGKLRRTDGLFLFSLNENLLINSEPWLAAPQNQLVFGKDFFKADRFRLEKNGQYLLAHSLEAEESFAPLSISFNRLDLGQFFSYDEKPMAGGLFNGQVIIHQLFGGLAFVSDLTIDGFSFRGDTIGDIQILASNPSENLYAVEALVKGYGNEVEVQGTYLTGEQPGMDIALRLREVNLSTLEGLAGGQLTHLEGRLNGHLRATGAPTNPEVYGSLRLSQAAFRVGFMNAPYRIPDGQINFDRSTIRIQSLSLLDSLGRNASISGSINMAEFSNPGFNLALNSRNFLLMNVPQGQNDLFWGRMFIDSDLTLRGNLTSPLVEGRLKLNQGSFMTIVVPQSVPEAIGDEGVVEFVSMRDTLFTRLVHAPQPDPLVSAFRNLNLMVNVEIDPQTDIKVIIDEFAGDYVEVVGGGVLSYGIDPGGRISLAGRYEISDGNYLLTFYDVISRNFRIQRGSSIVFTGDPMQAQVDITAIYNLRTSARELFESPIAGAGVDPALRQQYPFRVFLRMRGELLNPEISFEIGLAEGHQNAMDGRLQSRLRELSSNESELNKQVFALLMFGSFVRENPLASIAGTGGLSASARNSASRLLTQQLNRLSNQYIRGIDLNFEIESYEDFTTGEAAGRTELQVEVSRNFFDERLRLTLGGNIELEDETRRQTSAGEIAGDFLLEYLLNPEGTLILRAFRKKDFRDLFDGEVTQTGVALLLTRSYNRFRELYMKKEESPELTPDNETEDLDNDEQ